VQDPVGSCAIPNTRDASHCSRPFGPVYPFRGSSRSGRTNFCVSHGAPKVRFGNESGVRKLRFSTTRKPCHTPDRLDCSSHLRLCNQTYVGFARCQMRKFKKSSLVLSIFFCPARNHRCFRHFALQLELLVRELRFLFSLSISQLHRTGMRLRKAILVLNFPLRKSF